MPQPTPHDARSAPTREPANSSGLRYPLTAEELLVPATRYYLGRCTISTTSHAQALAAGWNELPENVRSILRRDIEEELVRDDAARERGESVLPLGMDCDRNAWELVRAAWIAAEISPASSTHS